MEIFNNQIKVKVGKSYKIKIPKTILPKKIHIDYILENKKYTHWSTTLIVYRYWSKRYGWIHEIVPYYTLAIYNDWNYNDLNT